MSDFLENRLKKLKIKRFLPKNTTIANYKPFVISNNFVFISGQLPLTKEGINSPGKIKNKINLSTYPSIQGMDVFFFCNSIDQMKQLP